MARTRALTLLSVSALGVAFGAVEDLERFLAAQPPAWLAELSAELAAKPDGLPRLVASTLAALRSRAMQTTSDTNMRRSPLAFEECGVTPDPSKASTCADKATDLHRLALELGTDKATHHEYTLFYPQYLEPLRGAEFDLLEIGVHREESLKLWRDYFPRATIWGADKDAAPPPEQDGWRTAAAAPRAPGDASSAPLPPQLLRLDQSDSEALRAAAALRPWRVVIDDGSHVPSHQLQAFRILFPSLPRGAPPAPLRSTLSPAPSRPSPMRRRAPTLPRPATADGVYIIEDIETSYAAPDMHIYGYPLGGEPSVVQAFAHAADRAVNAEFHCHHEPPAFSAELDAQIGSVTFIRNAIVVRKPPAGFTTGRTYRFRHGLACERDGQPHPPRTHSFEVGGFGRQPAAPPSYRCVSESCREKFLRSRAVSTLELRTRDRPFPIRAADRAPKRGERAPAKRVLSSPLER
eukprot:Transcript_11945.p1 GENE.Transcript_11945~~Transcript_11945.p1  ORF type:complete len:464 (-),score=86.64 Transcript_11945:21-1412(-)